MNDLSLFSLKTKLFTKKKMTLQSRYIRRVSCHLRQADKKSDLPSETDLAVCT